MSSSAVAIPSAMRVHHVAISTAQFERLRAFYVETLDVPVLGGFLEQQILFLDAGGVTLELVGESDAAEAAPGQTEPDGFERRGWQHLAWEVPDVDAAYADLLARGVTSHSPPEDFPRGAPHVRIAFLRDPDGNLLELVQPFVAR
jgi:catechol 2,3-dioxygenase-like lactoylglutathione lyase family enzyme